ncbi:hypothetical protein [Photobacterium iliopiscarium]|uniref:hypothetical protein n=1 Tax=Photobacterium iliopiscarium TaxID=56192 RepID=UPI001E3A2A37|nr:hypothetical protein [Photobacterium iliopiscarium]MCD9489137.1 hypothetical protein [Photobacterium iliopiscarium]MCF2245811.1 hypothetical protein [Photobacterium iliopiscarium]
MTRTAYVEKLCELSAKVGEAAKEYRLMCESLPEANFMTEAELESYDKAHNTFLDVGNEMHEFQNQYAEVFRQRR